MASPPLKAIRVPQPLAKSAPVATRSPSATMSSTAMFAQRTGGSNQRALAAIEQDKQAAANDDARPAPLRMAKLPALSDENRAQIDADIEGIVRILKRGTPDSGDQTNLLEAVRKWERKDRELSAPERAGRRTPLLDHFLLRLKMRAYSRSSFRSLWQDQYAIAYDTLWYELRGYWLEEFKRVVKSSETQRTEGAEAKEAENGAALIAKQEAMGLWGMLKGMGTGLVSIAGPQAAQYIGEQFDETAHIMFGHEWDSSEPLVWGMNAAQIGTAGGDVIMQLVMFSRTLGAKGGKILQLINNLDKFKKAQQVLAALGGVQGMLMATKGLAQLIQAKRAAGEKITAKGLIHDPAFVNQLVMLVSSGIGTAMAVKGAPSAQQGAIQARVAVLLSSTQITASISELTEVAQSDKSDIERELEYGRVLSGLIPQLVSLIIAGHGHAQARKEAKVERQQQAQDKAAAAAKAQQEAEAAKAKPPEAQADAQAGTSAEAGQKTMSKPGEGEATPARPTNPEIEHARSKLTDAHQAQMADEVAHRLAPRDAPPIAADVAAGQRESAYRLPKQGSRTVGEPHASLASAQALYDHVIAETGGNREVGIWRHPDTGEFIVQLGQTTAVGSPRGATSWQGVQHFHPNPADVPLWRMPSSADVSELGNRAMSQQHTLTEIVEYPLPNGQRGRAAYTVSPNGKLIVEFIKSDGSRASKTFDGAKDFGGYHASSKVFDAESIRAEVDQWLAERRKNEEPPQPVLGDKAMNAAAPVTPASPQSSKPAAASSDKPWDRAKAENEWKQSKKHTVSAEDAKAWDAKRPAQGEADFSDVAAEFAKGEPAQLPNDPARGLNPSSQEPLVAARVTRGASSKNRYKFEPLPNDPSQKPLSKTQQKDQRKNFVVLPESEARNLGFVAQGEDFTLLSAKGERLNARGQVLDGQGKVAVGADDMPVKAKPFVLERGGKQVMSAKANEAEHPVTGRASVKKTKKSEKKAIESNITPSLQEPDSLKFVVAKGELILKLAGNANAPGADHVTFDPKTGRVYLNDATSPTRPKKPKDSHQKWRQDFENGFPKDQAGKRDFGFGPAVNDAINKAIEDDQVFARTLRPEFEKKMIHGKEVSVDKLLPFNNDPQGLRSYSDIEFVHVKADGT